LCTVIYDGIPRFLYRKTIELVQNSLNTGTVHDPATGTSSRIKQKKKKNYPVSFAGAMNIKVGHNFEVLDNETLQGVLVSAVLRFQGPRNHLTI
jgi:hypothetical protein